MARCAFIKPGGERCGATAMRGYDTCYGHRPDLADERRRNAARGGRAGGRGRPAGGASQELAEVRKLLRDLTRRVLGEGPALIAPGRAAIANQLLNTRLRAIEQERKLKETEDLEARIEALECGGGQEHGRSRATS